MMQHVAYAMDTSMKLEERKPIIAGVSVLLYCLTLLGCSSYHEICCGYKWIDGGGSEISVVDPSGNVIAQKVSLISLIDSGILIEMYALDETSDVFKISGCSYLYIDTSSAKNFKFSKLSDLEAHLTINDSKNILNKSINTNSYSCLKSELR